MSLSSHVEALIRQTAAEIVMPRYQALSADDIQEKAPDDLVTIADKESELQLSEGLLRILPDAAVVGEEACAADPDLVKLLGKGTAWIIDPIDGTGNFAAGRPHFALMVALVSSDQIEAGWMYDPLRDRMCHATRGEGAFIDGTRVTSKGSGADLPITAISMKFMAPAKRASMIERTAGLITPTDPPMCAGEQYPRVVLGQNDIAVYERTLAWDHAPGALFLLEAGGFLARMDGSAYEFWDDRKGMLAASAPGLGERALRLLGEV
jgi:fructose-1,6-bisphosphatase/inositol monophosphatase family enzyme